MSESLSFFTSLAWMPRTIDGASAHVYSGRKPVWCTHTILACGATLIASVAIPTSLIATFTAMRAFHFTLNNLTMLGLTLAVGIVIDDAIVILENIYRKREGGLPARQAAIDGAREVTGAPAGPVATATAPRATGVQPCISCGLSLSANARFCRRCGTRQG